MGGYVYESSLIAHLLFFYQEARQRSKSCKTH